MTRKIWLTLIAIAAFGYAALIPTLTTARFDAGGGFTGPNGNLVRPHAPSSMLSGRRLPDSKGLTRIWRPHRLGPVLAARPSSGTNLPSKPGRPKPKVGGGHPPGRGDVPPPLLPHPPGIAIGGGAIGPAVAVSVPPAPSSSQPTIINSTTTMASSRTGFFLPPPGERRFVANEVVLDIAARAPASQLEDIARRHRLTRLDAHRLWLTGRTVHRWRIDDGRSVAAVIRALADDGLVAGAQPNYLFKLEGANDQAEAEEGDPAQYVVQKLHLPEAHRLATGNRVLVAVIDSGIDDAHADLAGTIAARLDVLGGNHQPHFHGTAMAGAIAAHGKLIGVAPQVRLLAVRALDGEGEGTTVTIAAGLDWAVGRGARVVNMSFAGPHDPLLQAHLAAAYRKNVVLIAAAGNAGPDSGPLYPAADANVIAVTATDPDDRLFSHANRGHHIAIAAPGVDILEPAPNAGVQLISGTSVAAAHVSGVAALLIERAPGLAPADIRRILASTATALGSPDHTDEFGAGLADAYRALSSTNSRMEIQARSAAPAVR